MTWLIPAKTFLVGEYVALMGEAALIVTTSPCFSMEITHNEKHQGIHPEAPARRWWAKHAKTEKGLAFQDPYEGRGGLGASSAQFLGAYLAFCDINNQKPTMSALLKNYQDFAWNGQGLRPSAYDLIAQSQRHCVYINKKQDILCSYDWVFPELAFVLVHTGTKMATHQHLQSATLPKNLPQLAALVEDAKMAFLEKDNDKLCFAINAYQKELEAEGMTLTSTLDIINRLKKNGNILAIKGCGAMGADVLLLMVLKKELDEQIDYCVKQGLRLLATSDNLHALGSLLEGDMQLGLSL